MSINGSWNVTVWSPMGELNSTLTLAAEGSEVTGQIELLGKTSEVTHGKANGEGFEWRSVVPTPMPGMDGDMIDLMEVWYTASVDGDTITGKMSLGPLGNAAFSGQRA